MSRKRRRKNIEVSNNLGLDAATISPDRIFPLWGSLNPRDEVNDYNLETIWRRARGLYYNFAEIRQAVKTMTMLMGYILPLPNTRDMEFNKAARCAFIRIAMNPKLFEVSGRLNFLQAQKYIEERAIIDGDVLTVMTRNAYDNTARVAYYSAPQVIGQGNVANNDYRVGCQMGKNGRVLKYLIKDYNSNDVDEIPASRCHMYTHSPNPADPRTPSELIAAITTAKDIKDINALHKQQVKVAALFGLIETKDLNDKKPALSDIAATRRNGNNTSVTAKPEAPLIIDGVKAISLEPGRKLETLHNNNPSNEIREFIKDLIKDIAYSVGLDPEVLYDINSLGSGSIRFSLAKCKDFARMRNYDREVWANRIYQHIISTEISAGRLQPCKYVEDTYNVKWILRNEWSIDLRHDAQAYIALYNQGLVTGDEWTLSHYGLTLEEVAEKRADEYTHLRMIADTYGLPVNLLIPNPTGGTPIDWDSTPDDEHDCPPDTEPETETEEI